jgi:catechol 2,3-dioxygenase-like lactoylglutathione lyase family enzyme
MRLEGLHHVTAITGDAPRNLDFYTRVLGLRLAAKTVNQDDPSVYHLFYVILWITAFFFVLTDNQRYLDKATVNALVLTDTARAGIFRYSTDHRNGAANSTQPSVDTLGNLLNPAAVRSFNVFSDVKDANRTGIDQAWVASQYLTRMPHASPRRTSLRTQARRDSSGWPSCSPSKQASPSTISGNGSSGFS